jgi:hypothetical protein
MRIADIQDQGTIVLVYLEGDGAPDKPVVFDHRSFRELTDARGGDLRGRCHVEYSEDGPPVLVFDKDVG